MKQVLEQGLHMCIYPEGTRNKTKDPLKSFKDGAFRLAIETGTPIIPAVIIGTKEMLPSHIPFYFRPGNIKMIFLPPVETKDMHIDELPALRDKLFDLMWNEITVNR